MDKLEKIISNLESNNIETRQTNRNEENNYHFLKRLFIDNKSNFSFVQKLREHYHSLSYMKIVFSIISIWFLIGYIYGLQYYHYYLITNKPEMNNLEGMIKSVNSLIVIAQIFIPIFCLNAFLTLFSLLGPFLNPFKIFDRSGSKKIGKRKKYSNYLLNMYYRNFINRYTYNVIIDMLINYKSSYKNDLDILENIIKNRLFYNVDDLCPTIKEKSQCLKKQKSIIRFAIFIYNTYWHIKFDKQKVLFNRLLDIPEIQLANYQDIKQYKPLTDDSMIDMIIEKQDIMKMNKKDITKYFQEILNENDKKLSELLSKINS